MKKLIIIGAGGMGRCLYCLAKESLQIHKEFEIKGFLENDLHALDGHEGYPPILGKDDDYEIEKDDVFVCSIGDVKKKIGICKKFKNRGAHFQTLIHHNANVGKNTIIGGVHIDPDVYIGENCLIQTKAIIGHDCKIGNYVRLDSLTSCVGGVIIEDCVTVFTSSVISHNVVLGKGSSVGACSFVFKKVKPECTVFGVPAKRIY